MVNRSGFSASIYTVYMASLGEDHDKLVKRCNMFFAKLHLLDSCGTAASMEIIPVGQEFVVLVENQWFF
jgi:hypothetical protein